MIVLFVGFCTLFVLHCAWNGVMNSCKVMYVNGSDTYSSTITPEPIIQQIARMFGLSLFKDHFVITC